MSLSRLLLVKASRLSRRRAMTENCNWKIRTGSSFSSCGGALLSAQLYNQILGRIRRISVALALLLQKLIASHDSVARTNASSPKPPLSKIPIP